MEGTTPVTQKWTRGDRFTPEEGQVLYLTNTSTGARKYYDYQDANGVNVPNASFEFVEPDHPMNPWTAYWRQDYDPDYLKVAVTAGELTLTTYDADTPYVIDKVTLVNEDAAAEPEPTTDPVETATPKPTQIAQPEAAGSSEGESIAAIVISVLGILGAIGAIAYQALEPYINAL